MQGPESDPGRDRPREPDLAPMAWNPSTLTRRNGSREAPSLHLVRRGLFGVLVLMNKDATSRLLEMRLLMIVSQLQVRITGTLLRWMHHRHRHHWRAR